MDISIQHPWFRRALGSAYPTRLFDQFFGEGMFDYDLFPYTASTISPYYRQSLFRSFFDFSNSGISEVNLWGWFYVDNYSFLDAELKNINFETGSWIASICFGVL